MIEEASPRLNPAKLWTIQQTRVNCDVGSPTRKRNTVVSCVHSFLYLDPLSLLCLLNIYTYDQLPDKIVTCLILPCKSQRRQYFEMCLQFAWLCFRWIEVLFSFVLY